MIVSVDPYSVPHNENLNGSKDSSGQIISIESDNDGAVLKTYDEPFGVKIWAGLPGARLAATILRAGDPTNRFVIIDTRPEEGTWTNLSRCRCAPTE